jgi:hypothetical protein
MTKQELPVKSVTEHVSLTGKDVGDILVWYLRTFHGKVILDNTVYTAAGNSLPPVNIACRSIVDTKVEINKPAEPVKEIKVDLTPVIDLD